MLAITTERAWIKWEAFNATVHQGSSGLDARAISTSACQIPVLIKERSTASRKSTTINVTVNLGTWEDTARGKLIFVPRRLVKTAAYAPPYTLVISAHALKDISERIANLTG